MQSTEIKPGVRLYHVIFGWCKVTHPVNSKGRTLVNLEADEIEYYAMGQGYVNYKRNSDGDNILLTPANQLFEKEEDVPTGPGSIFNLLKSACNAKLTFWKKEQP